MCVMDLVATNNSFICEIIEIREPNMEWGSDEKEFMLLYGEMKLIVGLGPGHWTK